LLLLLIEAPAASAHAAFVSGTPGPNDEVVGSPSALVVNFSQNLDVARTSLEVRDAAGATVARGGELGDGRRQFRLALPVLGPGGYEVRWTSFSAEDGELARGTYMFTVVAAPSPSPTPSPTATALAPASPPATPVASASPSPSAMAKSPAPSSTPGAGSAASIDGDGMVILPILAAALIVASLAVWLLRRRAT